MQQRASWRAEVLFFFAWCTRAGVRAYLQFFDQLDGHVVHVLNGLSLGENTVSQSLQREDVWR